MGLVCKPLYILTESVHVGVLEGVDSHDDLIITAGYGKSKIPGQTNILQQVRYCLAS